MFPRPGALLAALLLCAPVLCLGEGRLVKVPTRPGITTTVYWESTEGAKATVLLFPGGGGGFGRVEGGRPTSGNFLVRSVQHFRDQGFHVAIFGRPVGEPELGYAERISDGHLADIRAVLEFAKLQGGAPVWMIGTSRGTISATAAAIHMSDPAIAGLVLTSSVVDYGKPGAVPRQDLAAIRMPVLVYHHARDECRVCSPRDVPDILAGLTNAPVKTLVMASGGANPRGDPCEAFHWHGFIGMEKEAVAEIAAWIREAGAQGRGRVGRLWDNSPPARASKITRTDP